MRLETNAEESWEFNQIITSIKSPNKKSTHNIV